MQSKKWFILLFTCVAVIFLGIIALNLLADPFGAFGDNIFKWYSANMTNNPKTAKFTFIDERKGEFGAFIVGPSGSSGLSPQAVEKYTGLKCYNMFNYGADMAYTKKLTRYLIENHSPKHIILDMPVITASVYGIPPKDVTYYQPLRDFWRLPFLLADPKFALKKMYNSTQQGYVQQTFNVFNWQDGTYDKTRRETEPIGGMAEYLEAYPEFTDMPTHHIALSHIGENLEALREIKTLCDERGIELTVLVQPMLQDETYQYDPDEAETFLKRMAEITPFWNFANTSISHDPRYFYDTTHYRNSVGDMMLAKIFEDGSVYMPAGFGELVTAENAEQTVKGLFDEVPPQPHDASLTVLMYHNLTDDPAVNAVGETVSVNKFREQMAAVKDAGGSTVTVNDLIDYVYHGKELPPNPVLITFDDGYMSNYELAFPILKEFGHKAAIFVVGNTFGRDEYKDTGKKITPHFGADEAAEMTASGLIEIGSHTYDMHQVEGYDGNPRQGVLRREGEDERSYMSMFRQDFQNETEFISNPAAFAYPNGLSDDLSAILLNELGVKATFTTAHGKETVIKGLPASLLGLKRIAVGEDMSGEDIAELIEQAV